MPRRRRHRGLGVRVSKIKSLVYDHWDADMARGLMQVGNERGRQLYLNSLPEGLKPPGRKADEARRKAWVANKYQKLKWAEPEWRDSLLASRARASKLARPPVARKAGKAGKAGAMRKMPSLSSEG